MLTILIPIVSMLPSYRAPPKHIYNLIQGFGDHDIKIRLLLGISENNLVFPNNCEVKESLDANQSLKSFFHNISVIRRNLDNVDLVYVPISTPILIITFLANISCRKKIIAGPNIDGLFLERPPNSKLSFTSKLRKKIPILGRKIYEVNFLCDYFISYTEQQKLTLISKGISANKIIKIHHPVDVCRYNPNKGNKKFWSKFDINNEIVIFFTGKHTEAKGILELIEAFEMISRDHPNVSLAICGGGELEDEVINKTREMENAHYLGFLEEKDLQIAYASADIGIFPSKNEGFGLVYLESMSSGLPTIGVDRGGPSEIITDGVDGILIPDNSPNSIKKALEKLINDLDFKNQLGKNARKTVMKKYSPEAVAEQYLRVFKNI